MSSLPHAMSKKELAVLYAPHLSLKGAQNRLSRWLRFNPRLVEDLANAGYHDTQRLLTARQVEIIVGYLGEP